MDNFIYKYSGLEEKEFATLVQRYDNFRDAFNDVNKEPLSVYSPRSEKCLEALYLIRDVSKDLQKKKEEDMEKAAQVAEEETEKETKKEETEKSEKTTETEN